MLLRNARISGSASSEPVDILIEGGRITSIGALEGEGTDLGGRWVSPGLWDNHVHFSQWALVQQRLDVSAASSAAQAASMVATALGSRQVDGPLIGFGFRDGLWADEPTVDLLDAAAGERPVILVSGDLHAVWLNSTALAIHGFSGHPTGLLREDPAFEITNRIGSVPDDVLDRWVDAAARAAAARGIVGIVDLEMKWNLESWTRRMTAGTDSLRVEFGIYSEDLDQAIELGLRTGDRVTDLLSVGPFKVLTDGSLNTRTAYCYDEYPGREGHDESHGMLTVPPEDLLPLMRKAVAAGISPTVHAIGDHANALALDAFAEIGAGGRIEHAQLLAESDYPRFGQLGVVASVQPDHALDDRDVAEKHWAGRTGRAFALRSLLDAGATLALGSDAPVSLLDPWSTAAAAVTRTRAGREPWHPEQRISTAEALAASTRTAVAIGEIADLVVTAEDPLDADDLRTMVVAATILGGRFTHLAL